MEPRAFLIPLTAWAPLGAAIFAAQAACIAAFLRPGWKGMVRATAAYLVADLVLVALVRACASVMGRMEYLETVVAWRVWFLVLCFLLAPAAIALWWLAGRLARRRRRRRWGRPRLIGRSLVTATVSWVAAVAITLAIGGEFSFRPRPARITRVEVRLAALPRELDGLRLALIADHQIGGELMTPARAGRRLESLGKVDFDLLMELGDITTLRPAYQEAGVEVVTRRLGPLGSYAVAGNFDQACGTDSLGELLEERGVTFLYNEAARVSVRGTDLWLAGVGDPCTKHADLDRALAGAPEGAVMVLLAHSPDIIEEAVARGIPLVLSGHMHGGQVVAPFAGPVMGMSRYGTRFSGGHYQIGDTQLVVSRGLGEETIPLRLFCPAEIVLVTLRAGEKGGRTARISSQNRGGIVE